MTLTRAAFASGAVTVLLMGAVGISMSTSSVPLLGTGYEVAFYVLIYEGPVRVCYRSTYGLEATRRRWW